MTPIEDAWKSAICTGLDIAHTLAFLREGNIDMAIATLEKNRPARKENIERLEKELS